jgi:ABC-2 type transport system permease protein
MNRLYNAVKLDLYTTKAILSPFALTLGLAVVIGVLTKQPFVTMVVAMVFTTQLGSTIFFQVNEKNNLDKLYGILPLRKIERVLARYLYALILEICSVAFATVAALILYRALGVTMDTLAFLTVSGLTFVYYCFSVAILYPVLIQFAFSKGYLFSMVPIILMVFLVYLIGTNSGFLTSVSKIVPFFAAHPYLIILFSVGAGLVFFVVSFLIAYPLSKKKEL